MRYEEGNYRLGSWVGQQRHYIDKLTSESKQRLDALGFIWDMLTEKWEEGFGKLLQFKEREGHCKVAVRYKEGNYRLGSWVGVQRLTHVPL